MENRLANSPVKLVVQMDKAIAGVVRQGAALDLRPNLAEILTAESEALQQSHRHFLESKCQLRMRRKELAAAVKAGRRFATLLRDMRKHVLGGKGSREWEALGFRGTRQVPMKADSVFALLGAMAGNLELHPEEGCTELHITAAHAEILQTGLANAIAAVNRAKTVVVQAFGERAKLVKKARRRLRALLNDLAFALDGTDGRWFEFGFNRPGIKGTPAEPEEVTVAALSPNALAVNWPAVPLAEHYRVWARVVGVDAEMMAVGRTPHLHFVLQNVPSEAEMELGVTALNPCGEGVMSAVVRIKMPTAALPLGVANGQTSVADFK